jgi:hypothetical protein
MLVLGYGCLTDIVGGALKLFAVGQT